MRRVVRTLAALFLSIGAASVESAAQPAPQAAALPSIAARTQGLTRADGFLPYYWDAARGRLLLEIARFDQDVLYFSGVSKALGSVELGVDRGAQATAAVIHFRLSGPRVLVIQQNLRFRAPGHSAAAQQVMMDSFASSVLAALPVEAQEDGRVLVDATPLVIRDAGNLEGQLRRQNQGAFRLDAARSFVNLSRTRAFPKNTEIDAWLTFTSDQPGPIVSRIAPDGRSVTMGLHHSFVEPPDAGYRPRRSDPRIAVGGLTFVDHSKPYTESPVEQWVRRFRLEKKDPSAPLSDPVTPITFYIDPAIPEPFRQATKNGVLWWNRAFEAAGFRSAIRVADPGPDIDPLDVRHSYVFWTNRDERGFSIGGSYADPRTGEILSAKPRMDSHRIRTIGNYWDAYRPSLATTPGRGAGAGDAAGSLDCGLVLDDEIARLVAGIGDVPEAEAEADADAGADAGAGTEAEADGRAQRTAPGARPAMTQERFVALRQALVTAHEVGHTLGFGHNWNSSINDRASVMEYPSPRLTATRDGRLDVSDAYQRDVGEYDVMMVRYSYTPFAPDREAASLDGIVRETQAKGLLFTPFFDPRWSRYDDLASPAEYLRQTMAQRRILMDRYGADILQPGEAYGDLRNMRMWMTYLHHRWAIDTGVRYIGGQYDNLARRGDTVPPTEIVPAVLQREVWGLLLDAIAPDALAIPERLLAQLGSVDGGRDNEEFQSAAGYAFDHLSAARTLAAMVVEQVLEPDRAARLVAFADRQPDALTLTEVLDGLVARTWDAPAAADARLRALQHVTRRVVADAMMILGAHAQASPEVRAVTLQRLARLADTIGSVEGDPVGAAMAAQAREDIRRYLTNPAAHAPKSAALPQPPGAPLGARIP